ncbi:unnamed protein product, partial [Mesorhabditis spiculigera]
MYEDLGPAPGGDANAPPPPPAAAAAAPPPPPPAAAPAPAADAPAAPSQAGAAPEGGGGGEGDKTTATTVAEDPPSKKKAKAQTSLMGEPTMMGGIPQPKKKTGLPGWVAPLFCVPLGLAGLGLVRTTTSASLSRLESSNLTIVFGKPLLYPLALFE